MWHEHFQNLFNNPASNDYPLETETMDAYTLIRLNTEPPSIDEILAALRDLKNNKAMGTDKLPADVLKIDPFTTSYLPHPILTQIWNTETLPSEWKKALLLSYRKKATYPHVITGEGLLFSTPVAKFLPK